MISTSVGSPGLMCVLFFSVGDYQAVFPCYEITVSSLGVFSCETVGFPFHGFIITSISQFSFSLFYINEHAPIQPDAVIQSETEIYAPACHHPGCLSIRAKHQEPNPISMCCFLSFFPTFIFFCFSA